MKDYYQIMQVDRRSTEEEIKKAYRKLAVQYHPDKNPSPTSEDVFKEINEAYEVLSDPIKRQAYDLSLVSPLKTTYTEPIYTYRQRRTEPSQMDLVRQSLVRYTRFLFYIGLVYCGILAVDYTTPLKSSVEIVTSNPADTRMHIMLRGKNLLQTKDHHFNVTIDELQRFPKGSELKIYYSGILGAIIRVENYNGSFIINNLGSIYRNFLFAPVLLLIGCMVGIFVRAGAEFHVNLGVVVLLLIIVNVVFLSFSLA